MIKIVKATVVLCIAIFLWSGTSKSSKPSKNIIHHHNGIQLTWSDFKGRAVKNSPYAANTSSGFSFNTELDGDSLKIFMYCEFHKNESWVKKKSENESLLKHEQGHFDLTEIYCRKIRKEIKGGRFEISSVNKEIAKILKKENKALNVAQKKYDKETNHNLNAENQLKWDRFIDEELNSTMDYQNPIIKIAIQ